MSYGIAVFILAVLLIYYPIGYAIAADIIDRHKEQGCMFLTAMGMADTEGDKRHLWYLFQQQMVIAEQLTKRYRRFWPFL